MCKSGGRTPPVSEQRLCTIKLLLQTASLLSALVRIAVHVCGEQHPKDLSAKEFDLSVFREHLRACKLCLHREPESKRLRLSGFPDDRLTLQGQFRSNQLPPRNSGQDGPAFQLASEVTQPSNGVFVGDLHARKL